MKYQHCFPILRVTTITIQVDLIESIFPKYCCTWRLKISNPILLRLLSPILSGDKKQNRTEQNRTEQSFYINDALKNFFRGAVKTFSRFSENSTYVNEMFYLIVTSRKKFSTTHAIVSFSPDLSMKFFSNTVHTILKKNLQSFYTQRCSCLRNGIKIV